jgi:AraC family transcriptional regulator of adaptative response/methylated-DNA-[protein]-cysteine methyltransferase
MTNVSDDRLLFAVRACSLGQVLVAATREGIAAVLLGEDVTELRKDLAQRFAKSLLIGAAEDLEPLLGRVLLSIDDPSRPLNLPLDLCGTAFQRRVWNALMAIPPGETRSYSQIAAAIGAPGGSRAVAAACAANPVAVLVPCHRVIRGDGALAGYRWGLERKRALLARERALAHAA